MAMNSKQRLLGGIVLLGGSVLFAAILLQNNKQETGKTTNQAVQKDLAEPIQPEEINLQPLSVDVETEKKLLEEQRKAREQAVAEQERRAAEYLATQQQAEAAAAQKAAAEQAAILARRQSQMQSSDNIPPELVQEDKPATANSDQAKRDAELKAQQAKTDAAVKAKRDAEKAQQAKADAAAKAKRDAAKAQQAKADAAAKAKRDAEAKTQKAKVDAAAKAKAEDAARARDILENGDKKWMVQVALASTQYSADSMTAKLRAKGYQVTQSPTSKGIRIMVGPEKSRDSAESMRKKITADSSLNMKSAWVIGWVPLDQR